MPSPRQRAHPPAHVHTNARATYQGRVDKGCHDQRPASSRCTHALSTPAPGREQGRYCPCAFACSSPPPVVQSARLHPAPVGRQPAARYMHARGAVSRLPSTTHPSIRTAFGRGATHPAPLASFVTWLPAHTRPITSANLAAVGPRPWPERGCSGRGSTAQHTAVHQS